MVPPLALPKEPQAPRPPGTSSWMPSSGALSPASPVTALLRLCRGHDQRRARRARRARAPLQTRARHPRMGPGSPQGSASSGR
eukprot:11086390-Lingulodinium_polyedra.AAC.1